MHRIEQKDHVTTQHTCTRKSLHNSDTKAIWIKCSQSWKKPKKDWALMRNTCVWTLHKVHYVRKIQFFASLVNFGSVWYSWKWRAQHDTMRFIFTIYFYTLLVLCLWLLTCFLLVHCNESACVQLKWFPYTYIKVHAGYRYLHIRRQPHNI